MWAPWAYLGVVLGLAVAGGIGTHWLLCSLGRRLTQRSRTRIDDLLLGALGLPASVIVPMFAVQLTFASVPYDFPLESVLRYVLSAALCAAVGWSAIALVGVGGQLLVAWAERRGRPPSAQRSIATRVRLLTRAVNVVIAALISAIILMQIPAVRELGASMLASAGIAGIVAGLAARSVLGNLMAGIQVAIAGPILIGDAVVIDGQFGTIEEITASFVVVKSWDLKRVIIPIEYFLQNRFENWTFRDTTDLLAPVIVYADYTVDVPSVRGELGRIVESSPNWNGRVAVLQVTDCTERALQLRALVSAAGAEKLWELRCEVRERLAAFLQKRAESLPKIRAQFETADGAPAEPPQKLLQRTAQRATR